MLKCDFRIIFTCHKIFFLFGFPPPLPRPSKNAKAILSTWAVQKKVVTWCGLWLSFADPWCRQQAAWRDPATADDGFKISRSLSNLNDGPNPTEEHVMGHIHSFIHPTNIYRMPMMCVLASGDICSSERQSHCLREFTVLRRVGSKNTE